MSRKATASEPRIGQAPPPELFQELLTRARTVTYMVRMDEPAGTLVYMSPRCEELLGITPEIFLGETQQERCGGSIRTITRSSRPRSKRAPSLEGSTGGIAISIPTGACSIC